MSIFDIFGSTGDPIKDQAKFHGLLQAGLGLLQSKGNLGSALGQAGLLGMQGMQQYQQQQYQQQMQKLQLDELQRKKVQAGREDQMAALPGQFYRAPSQTGEDSTGGMDTSLANPGNQGGPGGFDYNGYVGALAQFNPMGALQMQASMKKDTTPIKLGAGDVLVDNTTFKPLASAPEKQTPSDIGRLYSEMNALPMGDPRRQAYMDAIRKHSTHAPATSVTVNTEKPLLNTIAGGLGKQIDDSLGAARGAVTAIGTAQKLKSAIDSGKVISGPGSTFRVAGLQIGQMLGIGGKDSAEILTKTRTVIQSMAQAELDAAQQMKGQGQITESERDIIRRAASGDINGLTGPEVKLLADTMEKTARYKIKSHQSNVKGLQAMPGAAPLMPFYQVEEPPAYTNERVRTYNPKTGKLE